MPDISITVQGGLRAINRQLQEIRRREKFAARNAANHVAFSLVGSRRNSRVGARFQRLWNSVFRPAVPTFPWFAHKSGPESDHGKAHRPCGHGSLFPFLPRQIPSRCCLADRARSDQRRNQDFRRQGQVHSQARNQTDLRPDKDRQALPQRQGQQGIAGLRCQIEEGRQVVRLPESRRKAGIAGLAQNTHNDQGQIQRRNHHTQAATRVFPQIPIGTAKGIERSPKARETAVTIALRKDISCFSLFLGSLSRQPRRFAGCDEAPFSPDFSCK